MKSFIAFLALIVAVTAFEYQEEFNQWKRTFGKKYATEKEELSRQIIWESNKNFVDNHNKYADKFGFTVAMNEFADLETAEFRDIYNGLVPRDSSYRSPGFHTNVTAPAAAQVDWRKQGYVTEVKNQGHCGSCWSFSTTGSIEGQHAKTTGRLVSLSEQQLIDCSTKYGNHGCKGGLMDLAFKYLMSGTVEGDDTEASYPYTAEDGTVCRYERSEVGASITGYKDIPRENCASLKNAAGTVGPISVAMDAGHKSFQLYHSGVYSEELCSSTKLDHGVLVIGYGEESMEPYWLVKNSWGAAWGMEGYFMISSRDNMCGICTQASYPTGVH